MLYVFQTTYIGTVSQAGNKKGTGGRLGKRGKF